MLALLKPEFKDLPENLTGSENESHRRNLANYLVQRKRGDIRDYLGSNTSFPLRVEKEIGYRLSSEYKKVFERAIRYAREIIPEAGGNGFQQRIRWWSALALLRALASSPAAAVATMKNRAVMADAETIEQGDELGRKTVLDQQTDEDAEGADAAPGCDVETAPDDTSRRNLLKLARDTEKLEDEKDEKVQLAVKVVKDLLKDGFHPIVFCRFIQTARYVRDILRKKLPKDDREKKSRTLFAQHAIKVEEVMTELEAVQKAMGRDIDVADFVKESLTAHGAIVSKNGTLRADLGGPEIDPAVVEAVGRETFTAKFQLPVKSGEIYLNRTHPIVEGLASHVMETAFEAGPSSVARRCGVIQTTGVDRRTTVILMRFRYHIITQTPNGEKRLLAEDTKLAGFAGASANAQWLDEEQVEQLVRLRPDMNVSPDRAVHFLSRLTDDFEALWPHLSSIAEINGERLLAAHRRVRAAAQQKHVRYRIETHLPPDVLGMYVYLPKKMS